MKPTEDVIEEYRKLFEDYITEIRQELRQSPYRSFDAPSQLWGLQRQAYWAIKDPNVPKIVREQLKPMISSLECLCKEAREKVDEVPDGDEWFEMWK